MTAPSIEPTTAAAVVAAKDVQAMRSWCADTFADYNPAASDAAVIHTVRRMYSGGLAGFLADA